MFLRIVQPIAGVNRWRRSQYAVGERSENLRGDEDGRRAEVGEGVAVSRRRMTDDGRRGRLGFHPRGHSGRGEGWIREHRAHLLIHCSRKGRIRRLGRERRGDARGNRLRRAVAAVQPPQRLPNAPERVQRAVFRPINRRSTTSPPFSIRSRATRRRRLLIHRRRLGVRASRDAADGGIFPGAFHHFHPLPRLFRPSARYVHRRYPLTKSSTYVRHQRRRVLPQRRALADLLENPRFIVTRRFSTQRVRVLRLQLLGRVRSAQEIHDVYIFERFRALERRARRRGRVGRRGHGRARSSEVTVHFFATLVGWELHAGGGNLTRRRLCYDVATCSVERG